MASWPFEIFDRLPLLYNTLSQYREDLEICFAAIPGKEMTIYYYADNETDIVAPWIPLETTTENGLACAIPVDFSAVYAPVGK